MENSQDLRYYDSSKNWDKFDPKWAVIDAIKEGENVLDVGCSYGDLGSQLKNKKCSVDGVEMYEPAIKEAVKVLDNVYPMNLNDMSSMNNISSKYSVITFMDVLEHCIEPEIVLKNFKTKLNANGRVYVSVPNIANFQERWAMLMGRFDYKKYGVMDETHVRFFTKATALKLVNSSFSNVKIIKATPRHRYLSRFVNLWPEMFAMQFVIEGRN